jgi:ubiquitin fusion degradation protein 1
MEPKFNPTYFDAGDPAQIHNILRASGRRGAIPQRFDEYYRCYPMVMCPGAEREHLNYGGKILMPTSALDKLTRLHITYPMLFELYNGQKQRTTHAGVLEFVAEEGKVYLPNWVSYPNLRGIFYLTYDVDDADSFT